MRIKSVPQFHVAWTLSLAAAVVLCASSAAAQQPVLDASCVASITLNFDPPARLVLPPTPAPYTTVTGGGAVTNCANLGAGPTMGTITYSLAGNVTCTSTANVVGTLDIVWTDDTESHAEVTTFVLGLGSVGGTAGLTATVTSGRFAGDQMQIVNLRDPLALVRCALTGLSRATGTSSITFTQPL
jgi:hypothetical protein